jgi:predicted nuclease of predicted toxin-antitoxin system
VKLLIDSCLWTGAVDELRRAGADVSAVVEWGRDPGDAAILTRAAEEHRVLITLDKDFGELAVKDRMPHSGIVRLVDVSVWQQAEVALRAVKTYGPELEAGGIVVVEADRTRVHEGLRQ